MTARSDEVGKAEFIARGEEGGTPDREAKMPGQGAPAQARPQVAAVSANVRPSHDATETHVEALKRVQLRGARDLKSADAMFRHANDLLFALALQYLNLTPGERVLLRDAHAVGGFVLAAVGEAYFAPNADLSDSIARVRVKLLDTNRNRNVDADQVVRMSTREARAFMAAHHPAAPAPDPRTAPPPRQQRPPRQRPGNPRAAVKAARKTLAGILMEAAE